MVKSPAMYLILIKKNIYIGILDVNVRFDLQTICRTVMVTVLETKNVLSHTNYPIVCHYTHMYIIYYFILYTASDSIRIISECVIKIIIIYYVDDIIRWCAWRACIFVHYTRSALRSARYYIIIMQMSYQQRRRLRQEQAE